MFDARRVLIATLLATGLSLGGSLPALAATGPTPSPTLSDSTPTATPTPTRSTTPPAPTRATRAARNISISYVSKTVARLTWTKPSDAGANETVHYYVRTTFSLGGKSLGARTTADTTATSITYNNVQPGSMLVPEVTTLYRKARGDVDRGNTYTQNQVAPSAPTAVTLKIKQGNAKTKPSATVTFKAPATSGGNGTLIDSYRVRIYDAATDDVVKTETLGSGDRNANITGLDYGKTYYAQVAAHNSAGYGKNGKSSDVKTNAKPSPSPTPTPTPTLTNLIQIPLPPVPGTTPTPTPKPTATPSRTATAKPVPTATTSASPTPTVSSTPEPGIGVFKNASDSRWFIVSASVALIVGLLLALGVFLYYRYRRRG